MNDVLDYYHRFPALMDAFGDWPYREASSRPPKLLITLARGCFADYRRVDFPLPFSKLVVASGARR